MGRKRKEVSTTQLDSQLMNTLSTQIKDYGVSKFAKLVNLDRVTIYNWMGAQQVEMESEKAILNALDTLGSNLVKQGVTMQAAVAKTHLNYA